MSRVLSSQVFTSKNVANVTITVCASYFGSGAIGIDCLGNAVWITVIKGWPTALRIKLCFGRVERVVAFSTDKRARFKERIILATKRVLGVFVFNNG